MSDLDVQLKYKNKNGGHDNLYPKTKSKLIQMDNGKNIETVLSDVEASYQTVIDEIGNKDIISAPEIIQARQGYSNLSQNILSVKEQLQQTTPYVVNPLMTQQEIQNIINTYTKVKFLSGTYEITFVNGVGFTVPSSRTIEFEDNARIVAMGSNLENYHLIKLSGVDNVTLINPTVIGERKTHEGTTGEWGFGISIEKSKNITLIKPKCNDCWGDGIYLGDLNENVMIDRPICDNNRRQGISVISCKTLTIIDPILKNTNGTPPESGIDFEPNLGTFGLENVRLVNPYTENNTGMGIVITLVQLGGTNKVVDITIENHKDVGSGFAMYVGACDNLKGSITVNNPLWVNSKNNAFIARDYTSKAPLIKVKSPTIINPHSDSSLLFLSDPRYGSVISLYREFNDTTINPLGSLLFEDVIITSTIETYAAIAVRDELTTKKVDNLSVRNLNSTGLTKRHIYSNIGVMKIIDYELLTDLISDISVTATDVIKKYTNKKATTLVKLTLQSGVPVGCKVTVKIESANTVEINPITNTIVGVTEQSQRISSNVVGSMIVLEKVSDTVWSAINKTGVWTIA